jgi:hypothetical protein
MTTLAAALENLYADVDSLLAAIVPDAKVDYRFVRRHAQDEQMRDLEKMPGMPRMYEFLESGIKIIRHLYTGGGTSGIEITVPLRIMYPATDPSDTASWIAAAISDWSRLLHDMYDDTSAAGIQARTCEATPTFIDVVDDPWIIMEITVKALLDIEQ